jgi:hypothetical protein
MKLKELVDKAGTIKDRITKLSAELKKVQAQIEKDLEFTEQKSVELFGDSFKVKVTEKTGAPTWNQEKLRGLKELIGDEEFRREFVEEWKHIPNGGLMKRVDVLPYSLELKKCFTVKTSRSFDFEPMGR